MDSIATKIDVTKNLIREAIEQYPKIAVATSFGKDSMVVLHIALTINPEIKTFSVMTRFKPVETFEYKDKITRKWNLNIEVYESNEDIPPGLSTSDPERCCNLLKVGPTREALKGLDAWITGLRRTEGETRTDYRHIEKSSLLIKGEEKDIVKVNPILDWEEVDVWKYMAINQIPVHPWYALGYRSLGCAPCSSIVDDQDTERAGRWQGTQKIGGECGIHTMGRERPN